MKEYTIDAKNRSLGRVATEVATILRGKNEPNFRDNVVPDIKLRVTNIDKIKTTGQKTLQKEYTRYSGYPGGLKYTKLGKAISDKGNAYVLKQAVLRMLPSNKLRNEIMKKLEIKN